MKMNSLISLLKYLGDIMGEKKSASCSGWKPLGSGYSYTEKHFMSLQCFRLYGAVRLVNLNSFKLKMDNPELDLFWSHPMVLYFPHKFIEVESCLHDTRKIGECKY